MGKIRAYQGSITDVEADAIVNAANNYLWMGSGVAGAIKRAGGQEIEQEAVKKGPIPVGEAVVTGAGKLRARHVIHAAAMGQDLLTDAAKIRAATGNSLRRADELGLKSIAFPALGTGVGGFPMDECAAIMVDAVRRHLAGGTSSLEEVVFALRDEDAVQAFSRVIDQGDA